MFHRRKRSPSELEGDHCHLERVHCAGTYWQQHMPDQMTGVVELRGGLDEGWHDIARMNASYGAGNIVIGDRPSRWKPKPVRVITTPEVVRSVFSAEPNPLDPRVGSTAAPEDPRAYDANGQLLWSLYSGGGVVSVFPASAVYQRVLDDVQAGRASGGVSRGWAVCVLQLGCLAAVANSPPAPAAHTRSLCASR